MEDIPNKLSQMEREMKRLVARMDAESTALNKILKVIDPRSEDPEIIPQNSDEEKAKNNPNKQNNL